MILKSEMIVYCVGPRKYVVVSLFLCFFKLMMFSYDLYIYIYICRKSESVAYILNRRMKERVTRVLVHIRHEHGNS